MTAWRRARYYLCYCVKQWGILSPRIPKGAHGTLPPRTQGAAQGHGPAGACVRDRLGEPSQERPKGAEKSPGEPRRLRQKPRGVEQREKEGRSHGPSAQQGRHRGGRPGGHVPPADV